MIKIRFEFTRFLFKLQNVVKIEFISIKGGVYLGVLQPDVILQVDGPSYSWGSFSGKVYSIPCFLHHPCWYNNELHVIFVSFMPELQLKVL